MAKRSKEEVLKLIKKMQRLTDPDNNPTEGEMQAAATKIQQLLKQYNLSVAEVKATEHPDDKKQDYDVGQHATVTRKRSSLPKFEQQLAGIVARSCECTWYRHKVHGTSKNGKYGIREFQLRFVGAEVDCIVAAEMYNYLCKTIYKLSRELFKTCSEQNSFWYGALHRLRERFLEAEKEFEEENKDKMGTYEMVLVGKKQEIERFNSTLGLVSLKSRGGGTKRHSDFAYGLGYAHGDGLDISKGKHLE